VWLADPGVRDIAVAAIEAGHDSNVIEGFTELDGRVALDISSTRGPRYTALNLMLYPLKGAGLTISGFEPLDTVADPDDQDIETAVEAWITPGVGNRRPLEALAGFATLERLIDRYSRQAPLERDATRRRASGYSFGAWCVSSNTPGSDQRLLESALGASDASEANTFVSAAVDRRHLDELIGRQLEPLDEDLLLMIAARPRGVSHHYQTKVVGLLAGLGPEYSEAVLEFLETTVRDRDGDLSSAALRAPGAIDPSDRLRASVEFGLGSPKAALRAEARRLLFEKWHEKPATVKARGREPVSVPDFERTLTGYSVKFDDDAAWSKARGRFEKLLTNHPAFRIEEADREFIDVETSDPGAGPILEALWAQADGTAG